MKKETTTMPESEEIFSPVRIGSGEPEPAVTRPQKEEGTRE